MGLVISEDFPFLAGSPDGKVTDQNENVGMIEIKNILYNKPVSLTQAAKLKSINNFCLHYDPKSKKLAVKKNHNYYYQCLGLLYVCKMDWKDFVVRTENPYELHVERLTFDEDLMNEMVEKLKIFYYKALLPEIVVPRHGKFPGIREPGVWAREYYSKFVVSSNMIHTHPPPPLFHISSHFCHQLIAFANGEDPD